MYKNFTFNIMVRLLVITASITGLIYCVMIIGKYLRSTYLLAFILLLLWELIYYVHKSNRDLNNFLLSIQNNDFSTRFSANQKGKSFEQLYSTFNLISDKLKTIRSEREAQYMHLQRLIEHINVGILSFDKQGRIYLINQAFWQLLSTSTSRLRNIQDLGIAHPELLGSLREIQTGERRLLRVQHQDDLWQLAIQATEFSLQGQYFKLISAQNIKGELEEKELEAWQKLIRVLTHEIMNSIAPISSLSETLHDLLGNKGESREGLSSKTYENMRLGLETIKVRSQGLLNFTEAYRNLTRLPNPKFQSVQMRDLCDRLTLLFRSVLESKQIDWQVDLPAYPILFLADPELLDQVLINLIKNAIEALENQDQLQPKIILKANQLPEGKVLIEVIDNGMGIPEDIQDRIFVPFYTTKEDGSGIGLSLCRQIMLLHKGSISLHSREGAGSVFRLMI